MSGAGAREELLERLRAAGQGEEAIERAQSEGRLATLAVELAFGGAPEHTLTQVARESRLDPKFLRQLLRAQGRPDPAPRERAYTNEDVELARLVRRFVDAGLPRDGIVEIARVLGQGTSQVAETVRHRVGTVLLQPGDSELDLGLRYARAADELSPLMGPVLEYLFRAHMRDGIRRELITEAEREAGALADTRDVTVAFADLVGYTRLGEKLATEELGRLASRLAELASSAAKRPTRLVKTIGDAAMFVSPSPSPLLATITTLLESTRREGKDFPQLRVGIAKGPATPRGGDWFGSTVNLASRVTDAAKPGRILATEPVSEATASDYQWKRRRRFNLKGVEGRPRLFSLDIETA